MSIVTPETISVDFDLTYKETPLGHGIEIIRFW